MAKKDKTVESRDRQKDRQIRRQEKKEIKDYQLGEDIAAEAKRFGVDIDAAPTTVDPIKRKEDITEAYKKTLTPEQAADVDRFAEAYKPADRTVTPLDKEQLKESLRKQKRAKVFDIITGVLGGATGTLDPEKDFRATQIRKEREALYPQYLEATTAARQRAEEWDYQYRKDLLDRIDKRIADEKTSEKDKAELERIKAQTQKLQAETEKARRAVDVDRPRITQQTPEGNWQMKTGKGAYSDLYYKLTANSPLLINELAKLAGHAVDETGALKRNLSSDEIERFSNTLLSKAFDIKTDEAGNQIATPKPGKENYIQDLSNTMVNTNQFKADLQKLEDDLETELHNVEKGWGEDKRKKAINDKYAPLISAAAAKVNESDSKLKNMLAGDYAPGSDTQPAPQQQTQVQTQPTGTTKLGGIMSKYK